MILLALSGLPYFTMLLSTDWRHRCPIVSILSWLWFLFTDWPRWRAFGSANLLAFSQTSQRPKISWNIDTAMFDRLFSAAMLKTLAWKSLSVNNRWKIVKTIIFSSTRESILLYCMFIHCFIYNRQWNNRPSLMKSIDLGSNFNLLTALIEWPSKHFKQCKCKVLMKKLRVAKTCVGVWAQAHPHMLTRLHFSWLWQYDLCRPYQVTVLPQLHLCEGTHSTDTFPAVVPLCVLSLFHTAGFIGKQGGLG